MLGKGKERFIEAEIKKRMKVNNQRSKICFVHTILSRIVVSLSGLYINMISHVVFSFESLTSLPEHV